MRNPFAAMTKTMRYLNREHPDWPTIATFMGITAVGVSSFVFATVGLFPPVWALWALGAAAAVAGAFIAGDSQTGGAVKNGKLSINDYTLAGEEKALRSVQHVQDIINSKSPKAQALPPKIQRLINAHIEDIRPALEKIRAFDKTGVEVSTFGFQHWYRDEAFKERMQEVASVPVGSNKVEVSAPLPPAEPAVEIPVPGAVTASFTGTAAPAEKAAPVPVKVMTASVIISAPDDPYCVLVADSKKHPKPVIPGGKVELSDMKGNALQAAVNCILRETREEIGARLQSISYLGVATDPGRDVRSVPASTLKGAIVSPALPENTPDDAVIQASYGCPDYIFKGMVDKKSIHLTEELEGIRFIDIRTLKPGDLAAGHDVVVLRYRQMLDNRTGKFPAGALQSFDDDRREFTGATGTAAAPPAP